MATSLIIHGAALGLLSALFIASCSGPRIKVLDRPVTATRTSRALTNSTALESRNRETLREEDLLEHYKDDGREAIRELLERYRSEPTEARRQVLAEMTSDRADRLSGDDPLAALGNYLDSASLTGTAALASVGEKAESPDRTLYDYCAARVSRLIKEDPVVTPSRAIRTKQGDEQAGGASAARRVRGHDRDVFPRAL